MKEYYIGVAVEFKTARIKANSLDEAHSKLWETLPREIKDCHTEQYELER